MMLSLHRACGRSRGFKFAFRQDELAPELALVFFLAYDEAVAALAVGISSPVTRPREVAGDQSSIRTGGSM